MEVKRYLDTPDNELMALLLLADPDEPKVLSYLQKSEIFVATLNDKKVGVLVLVHQDAMIEIKNIAVDKKFQRKGIGKVLVEKSKRRAQALGVQTIKVGTGNSSLGQLDFYQRCGFRIVSIIPNYFINYEPSIYEDGIRCIDMLILKLDLLNENVSLQ